MGPKVKGEKKKKAATPENGGELTAEDKVKMFMLSCQSLQVQLSERSDEASEAIAAKKELRLRFEQLSKDYENEKLLTKDIMKDMTRQYKSMQDELLGRIAKLEQTVQSLNGDLLREINSKAKLERDMVEVIGGKDEEIASLKKKMDDMADEFSDMLKETLEKMRDKIEVSSNYFDDVPGLASPHSLVNKIEEIKLPSI